MEEKWTGECLDSWRMRGESCTTVRCALRDIVVSVRGILMNFISDNDDDESEYIRFHFNDVDDVADSGPRITVRTSIEKSILLRRL